MTLRARVTLAAGFAVLLAVVVVSVAVYAVVRGSLYDQIDRSLSHDGPVEPHGVEGDISPAPRDLPLMNSILS